MIVFIVTFTLFFIEAIIHYNYGTEQTKLHFPTSQDLIKIVITVGIFSYLNSIIIKNLSKYYHIR